MSRIEGTDPSGSGINELKVDSEGRGLVFSVIEEEFDHSSEHIGEAYNWSSGILNLADGDTVLLIKNTSSINDLHIESITINSGSTASQWQVHLPTTEVTVTGSTVVGTNLNTGRQSNVADAVAASAETNNSQGNIIFTPMMAADINLTINTIGLIISKNKSVAVDVVTAGSEAGVTIRAFFKTKV